MAKIKDRFEEKRKLKLIDSICKQYYDALKPELEDKTHDEIVKILINRWIKELEENRVHRLGDVSMTAEDVIVAMLDLFARFSQGSQKIAIEVHENIKMILAAEKEKYLMNEDLIEVMNNKTEATPSKPKGLRV